MKNLKNNQSQPPVTSAELEKLILEAQDMTEIEQFLKDNFERLPQSVQDEVGLYFMNTVLKEKSEQVLKKNAKIGKIIQALKEILT